MEIPKYDASSATKKIAIIQGGAWGDNINSTLMLKPLKEHFGDAIIDVHTSNLYASAFGNNPYINKLIQHNAVSKNDAINIANTVPAMLHESNYDIVSAPHPMFNHEKWSSIKHPEWGCNLIFAWVRALEDLGVPYGELETILQLTEHEKNRADQFIDKLPKNRKNVLMEIHGESDQTPWDPHWTVIVGEYLCARNCNLLISHKDFRGDIAKLRDKSRSQIHWVGEYSIRECAQLFNRCDTFISVSSGLSNACNTNWCKSASTKWIEVCNSRACSSAAIRDKDKIFWHNNDLEGFIKLLKENRI